VATLREANLLAAGTVALHYPGRNPLSGDHVGYTVFLEKVAALVGDGATITRELHDAFGSDDHAVQLLTVSATAKGRSCTWQATATFHVRDGRFSECWISIHDQHALDEFLNSLAS